MNLINALIFAADINAATHEHRAGEFSTAGFGKFHKTDVLSLKDAVKDHKKAGDLSEAKDTHTLAKHISNREYKKANAHFKTMSTEGKNGAVNGISYATLHKVPAMGKHSAKIGYTPYEHPSAYKPKSERYVD